MKKVITETLALTDREVDVLKDSVDNNTMTPVAKSFELIEYVGNLVNEAYEMGVQSGKLSRGDLS